MRDGSAAGRGSEARLVPWRSAEQIYPTGREAAGSRPTKQQSGEENKYAVHTTGARRVPRFHLQSAGSASRGKTRSSFVGSTLRRSRGVRAFTAARRKPIPTRARPRCRAAPRTIPRRAPGDGCRFLSIGTNRDDPQSLRYTTRHVHEARRAPARTEGLRMR